MSADISQAAGAREIEFAPALPDDLKVAGTDYLMLSAPKPWAASIKETRGRLAGWRIAWRRRRAEARTWSQAGTLEELATLTAWWLRGWTLFHPGVHGDGPDPETQPIVDVLAAVNMAGLLTETSQPGELATFQGRAWRQRAALTAFVADSKIARALVAQASVVGLVVRSYPPGRRVDANGKRDAVDVTTWEGHGVMTGMGDRISPRAVRRIFCGCDRQAVREVTRAWQVTLIDPEWGRDTLLWLFLTQFLNSRTLHTT